MQSSWYFITLIIPFFLILCVVILMSRYASDATTTPSTRAHTECDTQTSDQHAIVSPTYDILRVSRRTYTPLRSPQPSTTTTDNVLPSYVESRSVLFRGKTDVLNQPFVQKTNHMCHPHFQKGNDALIHEPANACPRVNIWKNGRCGLFV